MSQWFLMTYNKEFYIYKTVLQKGCGVQNATRANQGNLACARTF